MELKFNHEKQTRYEAIGMTRREYDRVLDKIGRLQNVCNFPVIDQTIALACYMADNRDAILDVVLDRLYGTEIRYCNFSKIAEILYTHNDVREFIVSALELIPEKG